MRLNELRDNPGARKPRKRIGRGIGSGKGKTSGKGQKGQKSRSGVSLLGFEGGQMPLYRRIARRGFSNHPFRNIPEVVDVRDLNRFAEGATVDRQALVEAGMIGSAGVPIKLLGSGNLERALTVRIDRASSGACRKVTAAGGTIQLTDAASADGPDGASASDEPVADESD